MCAVLILHKFTLLAVAGATAVSERRCPMTQFRMGVELVPINASGERSLRRFHVAGSQHASTLAEARDYAALEAFYVVFGAHHAFPMPLFEKKITRGRKPLNALPAFLLWDCIRIIDVVEQQGLMWTA